MFNDVVYFFSFCLFAQASQIDTRGNTEEKEYGASQKSTKSPETAVASDAPALRRGRRAEPRAPPSPEVQGEGRTRGGRYAGHRTPKSTQDLERIFLY